VFRSRSCESLSRGLLQGLNDNDGPDDPRPSEKLWRPMPVAIIARHELPPERSREVWPVPRNGAATFPEFDGSTFIGDGT
jgi:hypothetical protein